MKRNKLKVKRNKIIQLSINYLFCKYYLYGNNNKPVTKKLHETKTTKKQYNSMA